MRLDLPLPEGPIIKLSPLEICMDAKEEFSLEIVLKEVFSAQKDAIQEKDIQVNIESSGAVVPYANKILIHNAINNLIENAINYNHKSGYIYAVLKEKESKSHLTIENSGEVLDTALFDSVFVPFNRMSTSHKGSGLGLATVKNIIESHKGSLCFIETDKDTTKIEIIL